MKNLAIPILRKAIADAKLIGASIIEINAAKRAIGFIAIEDKGFDRWIGSRIEKHGDLYLQYKQWCDANHWKVRLTTRNQFDAAIKKFAIIPNK